MSWPLSAAVTVNAAARPKRSEKATSSKHDVTEELVRSFRGDVIRMVLLSAMALMGDDLPGE